MEAGHVEQRSKDVLFALLAATNHVQALGRLQLQKLIYLFDILAIAWREVSGSESFSPWKHGPYDLTIQNAADCLAFRGLVSINKLRFRGVRKAHAAYSLTAAGKIAVEQLSGEKHFADDLALFEEIAREVNRRGWSEIKEIVYSEPTYNLARSINRGNRLSVRQSQNLSWKLITQIRTGFEAGRTHPMSRRTLVQVFFAMLDEYRETPEANL
jgi:hypothetical protein